MLILDLAAPSPGGTERGGYFISVLHFKLLLFSFSSPRLSHLLVSFPPELGGSSLNTDSIRKFLQQASLLGKALQDSQKYGWSMKDHGDYEKDA